jgi:general secretion pathway protein N
MSVRRYVAMGLLTFAVFFVAFAPASLFASLVARQLPGTSFTEARGTVWSGSARMAYHTEVLGHITWRLRPAALLTLRLAYDAWLDDGTERIDARIVAGTSRLTVDAAGTLAAVRLDALLAQYDIIVPGTFRIESVRMVRERGAALPDVRGELHWTGGEVRYRLGDANNNARLPAMVGFIDSSAGQPEVSVYAVEDETPLILARLAADGWITIGITKRFTHMTGQPWHGDQPEHAVVVEVQEKLF